MIRVLHLINGLNVGGAEMLLLETARRLDRSRFDVRVASLLGPGALGRQFEDAGIPLIDLSNGGRFSWRSGARLRRHLRAQPCDLVHAHLLQATLLARWLRRRGVVSRLVSSQHFPPSERGGILRRIHRRTAAWDDVTVAVSASIAEELGRNPRCPRVVTVDNGIDLTRFRPDVPPLAREEFGLTEENFVIGTTARLVHYKGIDVLIRAAAQVTREAPNARFLIAGEGSERPGLESLIRDLELPEHVQLVGVIEEVERFLTMIDALCLPSRREPFGLSAAEAMACKRPVVHSAVGGLAAMTEDGTSGLHVVDHADPAAFAARLLELIGDADLRRRLADAGTARVRERFDIERTASSLASLYEEMMG